MRGWCQASDRGAAPQHRSQRPAPGTPPPASGAVLAVSWMGDHLSDGRLPRGKDLASCEAFRAGDGRMVGGVHAICHVLSLPFPRGCCGERLSAQPFHGTVHVAGAGWVSVNPSNCVIPSVPPGSSFFCGFRLLWVSSGPRAPAPQANPDHLSFARRGPGAGPPLVPSLAWPFPSPLPLLPRICHFTESSIFTAPVFSCFSPVLTSQRNV